MTPEVDALLRVARETLAAAELLFREGHFRSCVSRSYYAMFYCAEALHLSEGRSYSRHGAVISAFGRHFIKTGRLDAKLHMYLCKAFDDRNLGDYEFMRQVSEPTARTTLERAREFLGATTTFLNRPDAP